MNRSPIGTNQRVIVICVKYSDAATTRMANASDWATVLNNQVSAFYGRATYNQTTFQFEVPSGGPADGWFSLGYPSSSYSWRGTGQDAIRLADPYVNFANYDRVLVITNWPDFGGQGTWGWAWAVGDGIEYYDMSTTPATGQRVMSLSIVNEWVASAFGETGDAGAAVAGHELGHQLDVQTHYGDLRFAPGPGRDTITPWDIMGLSPFQRHFLGWAKRERGWLAAARVTTVGAPVPPASIDQTVRVKPLETSTPNGTQLIRIPFSNGTPFSGLVVENRQATNGDEQLPASGILLSLVDESPNVWYGFKDIVLEDSSAPGNLDAAPLGVGQGYVDSGYGISVDVTNQVGADYDVRVRYQMPANRSDPAITPWGAPPWETPDIWIDSQKNGWDTYRYTDSAGNPTGQGDDAWVNHANRVYVRIRNLGAQVATNVRVQVFVNQPPGLGDAGPDWAPIGAIVFASVPAGGAPVQDFVLWTPTVAAHTCLRAVIDDQVGELSSTNNMAQENVALFETSTGSPWEPVELKLNVYNPHQGERTTASFVVSDIPEGWGVIVDPPQLELDPGGSGSVFFAAHPAGPPDIEDERLRAILDKYQAGFIGKPSIQAVVPYADTFVPIGGVDVWVHMVDRTELSLKATGDPQKVEVTGQLRPAVAEAIIAIDAVDEGGTSTVTHLRTNADGIYSGIVGSDKPLRSVQALFAGDATNRSAESDEVKTDGMGTGPSDGGSGGGGTGGRTGCRTSAAIQAVVLIVVAIGLVSLVGSALG
jgi:M6 family metalloprotease-like protein